MKLSSIPPSSARPRSVMRCLIVSASRHRYTVASHRSGSICWIAAYASSNAAMSAPLRLSFANTRQLLRGERSVMTRRTPGRRSASAKGPAIVARATSWNSSLVISLAYMRCSSPCSRHASTGSDRTTTAGSCA